MPRKFVRKKVKTGYHFVLKASNGDTIAQFDVHSSKSGAKNGIESVIRNAPTAALVDETGE